MKCKFTLLEAPGNDGKGYWDFQKQSDDRLLWLFQYILSADRPLCDRRHYLFALLNGQTIFIDSCAYRLSFRIGRCL